MASAKKLYKLRLRERPRLGRAKPCQSVRVLGGAEQKVQGGELADGPQKRWGRALAKAGEHGLLLQGPGAAGAQRIKNVPQLFLDDGRRAEQVKFFKRHVPGVARVHRLERRPVALGFEQLFERREALDGTAQHRHRLPRLHRPQYLPLLQRSAAVGVDRVEDFPQQRFYQRRYAEGSKLGVRDVPRLLRIHR